MDALDAALLSAWSQLSQKLREDRAAALHRAQRLTRATLRRPVRPWCCCIRASDTRLLQKTKAPPAGGERGWGGRTPKNSTPQLLHLSPKTLRSLCAPIYIDWPGQRWTLVAQQLGQHCETLRSWITRGVFESRTQHPGTFGSRGKPVPVLWTKSPIDPNAELGRAPDPHWGTLWLDLHKEIPDAASLTVQRVPVFNPYTRRDGSIDHRFRGYRFLCPGLTTPCNRKVDRLYLPIPVWTIHQSQHASLTRQPEHQDTRWACHHCHNIKYISFITKDGWNEFIAHLTSGLLYGHEVERPKSLKPKRKRKYKPRPRKAPRQDQAKSLRAQGKSHKEIAKAMHISPKSVSSYLKRRNKTPRNQ